MQKRLLPLLLLLLLFLIACGGANPEGEENPETTPPTAVPTAEIPRVVDTPTPSLPPTWTPGASNTLPGNGTPVNGSNTPTSGGGDTLPGVGTRTTYTIQRGDTLGEIAIQFGVTLDRLVEVNNITDIDRIEVGDVLIIPND